MKHITTFIFTVAVCFSSRAQYDFEKFPAIKYKTYDWKTIELENKVNHILLIPEFFKNRKTLNIDLTYFIEPAKNSEIKVWGFSSKIVTFQEDIPFTPIGLDSLRIADINGDGLKDLKISSYYMGNGLASLNIRIVYLFQQIDGNFLKTSYDDKMGDNRVERDFDNDRNFEIITMTLQNHKNHNYWLFNIYNFLYGKLVNVNSKANYPIMVQFLEKETFKTTTNLSRKEMKKYEIPFPKNFNDN